MTDGHSQWHAGERALQERAGSAELLANAADRILRPFMSEQHRAFFPQLPFLIVGCIDDDGWPWASILVGDPGFVSSPDPTRLRVDVLPPEGDPLAGSLSPKASLGLLGIELPTRRRNRLNGHVVDVDAYGFLVGVDQSYGNCPQYIQRRDYAPSNGVADKVLVESFSNLDDSQARSLLAVCDTFFVATYASDDRSKSGTNTAGVDVSHRGGRPGFVKIDPDGSLTVPDYSGNRYYNTLGNILVNPRAGIVVPDFERGDLLLVTGEAFIGDERDDSEEVRLIEGAELLWRVRPKKGLWLRNALRMRFDFRDWSPRTLATGTWDGSKLKP
jgi:predicted pyridoxine 5'-phosphate oxidase superfamily flavin-nucleotide-binding protein